MTTKVQKPEKTPPTSGLAMTLLAVLLAGAWSPAAAAPVSLTFANSVQNVNGLVSISPFEFGITGNTVHFEEVAPGVDLRITVSSIGTGHAYDGLVPNRNPAGNAPAGDLGFYYSSSTSGTTTGGIAVNFAFFQSDGLVNGRANTTTAKSLDASFAITDVDGESSQTERVRAYTNDGLTSYQVASSGGATVSNNGSGTITFSKNTGPFEENDRRGAVVLNYTGTSSFTLQFESTTTGSGNPVFVGLDGNASTLPHLISGGNAFGPVVNTAVPEPASLALFGILFAGLANWRRKGLQDWWRRSKLAACVSRRRRRVAASQVGI